MVMIRPGGKAQKIAEKIMKTKFIKIEKPKKSKKLVLTGPYLQH
jgi:hypothetical protein